VPIGLRRGARCVAEGPWCDRWEQGGTCQKCKCVSSVNTPHLPRLQPHKHISDHRRPVLSRDENLVRLPSEDQKIIHAIGFHEILLVEQFVSGLDGFANDHIFTHAMIASVAIAINDSNPSSWSKR
jgi:hypothetical protein